MEYPIKDVKIERLASFSTRKDGTPLLTKADKPFKKVLIDVDNNTVDDVTFTGKLSMLDFDGVADDWKEGDLITGNIIKDGEWWNFELPRTSARDRIAELEKENSELRDKIIKLERDSISDDDLPF